MPGQSTQFDIKARASVAEGAQAVEARSVALAEIYLQIIRDGHQDLLVASALETIEIEDYRNAILAAMGDKQNKPISAPPIVEVRGKPVTMAAILATINAPIGFKGDIRNITGYFFELHYLAYALKEAQDANPSLKTTHDTTMIRRATVAKHLVAHCDFDREKKTLLTQHLLDVIEADAKLDLGPAEPKTRSIMALDEILPDPVTSGTSEAFRAAQIANSKKFFSDWSASEKPDEITDIYLDSLTSQDRAKWERAKIKRQTSSTIFKMIEALPAHHREDALPLAKELLLPRHFNALSTPEPEHTAPLSAKKNKIRLNTEIAAARKTISSLITYRNCYYPSPLQKIIKSITTNQTFLKYTKKLFFLAGSIAFLWLSYHAIIILKHYFFG